MVKGVHKKIIEVKDPSSDYFEKAVFYLKPEVTCLPPQVSEAAAQMLLEELDLPKKQNSRHSRILPIIAVAAVIVLITACAVILR